MKILINTASTLKGGGVQVAASFIEECKEYKEHEYFVILSKSLEKLIDQRLFPANFSFRTIEYRPATRVFSFKSHDSFFKRIEKEFNPDAVFTTTGPAYWRPKVPHVIGYNLPHHIYPESPYLAGLSYYRRLRWIGKKIVAKYFFARDADAICVQTDDVNERVRRFLKKSAVYTVSNTVNTAYLKSPATSTLISAANDKEFRLLTLSAWYPHKNLTVINDICRILDDETMSKLRFVLTIPNDLIEKYFTAEARKIIINIGPISVKDGPAIYSQVNGMFLPTLLECFSASYAEAMIMKKPILTSDMGFARTVCKDAAVYFDPVNAEDIANKIKTVMDSPDLQASLVERGMSRFQIFGSAKKRAEEYLKIIESIALNKYGRER